MLAPKDKLTPFSTIKLDGFHVILRPPRPEDCAEWLGLRRKNRKHLQPYEPRWGDEALTPDFFHRKYERQKWDWQQDLGYAFLLFTPQDERMIGALNILHVIRGAGQQATLGYWLDQEHQGMGYMSAAIRRIIHFAGDTLKLERLNASTIEENERSRKLLTRLGFTEEGRARQYIEINGQRRDHILFGLLIDEFMRRENTSYETV
jgi:[ribosomal protein S5]-alanine N-acetyltransferase